MDAKTMKEAGGTHLLLNVMAEDLTLLCRLHDREADTELIEKLRQIPVRDWFGINLDTPDAEGGIELLEAALAEFPDPFDRATLDTLAADFADIYLTFGKRLSPNESYWMTEDHLERQEPMFAVRRWYRHYGLTTRNWRQRSDDHLVYELEFVIDLLRIGDEAALIDAASFLDRHLLAWAPSFLSGVAGRSETEFYAGIAVLTGAYLDALRTMLEIITGRARDIASLPPERTSADTNGDVGCTPSFIPGLAPSW